MGGPAQEAKLHWRGRANLRDCAAAHEGDVQVSRKSDPHVVSNETVHKALSFGAASAAPNSRFERLTS
jgi:hypothetical protein